MIYLITALTSFLIGILTVIIPQSMEKSKETKIKSGYEHHKTPVSKTSFIDRWFK